MSYVTSKLHSPSNPYAYSERSEHTRGKVSRRICEVDSLFNFQVFQGWTRRLLRWTPETPTEQGRGL